MKKIDIKKLNEIKSKHLSRCKELVGNQILLSSREAKMLFTESPFDENNQILSSYVGLQGKDLRKFYEKFRKFRKKKWCGPRLIESIAVDVCPYCGINYFSTVSKKQGDTISEATFDHYISQDENHSLALNLYNLIPSCKNCNSTFKTVERARIINPFFHSLEKNIKFEIAFKDPIDLILLNNNQKLDINIKNLAQEPTLSGLIDNHISLLALEQRYNYFQGIAKSIIKKKIYYNKSYINELTQYPDLTENEIKTMLTRQDIFNENEPFLKFKNDIWEEFDC